VLVNNPTSSMVAGIQRWLDDFMEEHFTLLLTMAAMQCKKDSVRGKTIN